MKKWIALISVLVLLLSFTACIEDDKAKEDGNTNASEEKEHNTPEIGEEVSGTETEQQTTNQENSNEEPSKNEEEKKEEETEDDTPVSSDGNTGNTSSNTGTEEEEEDLMPDDQEDDEDTFIEEGESEGNADAAVPEEGDIFIPL